MFPIHSTSAKENTESSVIFLWKGVLILNGKVNKDATSICFEIRIRKKTKKELFRKVPSKIYGSNSIMENKNKNRILVCEYFRISSLRNGAYIKDNKKGNCKSNLKLKGGNLD